MDEQQALTEEFLTEAGEHLENVEDDVLRIEQQGSDRDDEVISHLFRAIHSIKGGSSFLELENVTRLSHALENIIDKIRDGKLIPTESITEAILGGIDKLKLLLKELGNEMNVDIHPELEALKQLDSSEIIDDTKSPEESSESAAEEMAAETPEAAETAEEEKSSVEVEAEVEVDSPAASVTDGDGNWNYIYHCTINLIAECDRKQRPPEELFGGLKAMGNVLEAGLDLFSAQKITDKFNNSLLYYFVISTVIEQEELLIGGLDIAPVSIKRLKSYSSKKSGVIQFFREQDGPAAVSKGLPKPKEKKLIVKQAQKEKEAEKTKLLPSTQKAIQPVPSTVPPKKLDTAVAKSQPASSIRIPVPVLDRLMNLASELVLVRNQMVQIAEAGDMDLIRATVKKLNVVTTGVQAGIMQTRMQPVDTVFSKFTRLVRDLSKKIGKNISLEIKGREVELDKNIIEAIGDPLTHLIRNAVDHGIESPKEREAQNKPRHGRVVLSAMHEAGQVIITVKDDGRGMDPEKLKLAAVNKGLYKPDEIKTMTQKEAYNLIFAPGFSTAEAVTDISGRGVGMDVVKTNFQKLGGIIEIKSQVGTGTSIEIRLPLTLTIIPSLIVSIENLFFAIPQYNIAEVVCLYGEEIYQKIKSVNNQEVFSLRGKLMAVIRLSKLLRIDKSYRDPETDELEECRRERDHDRRTNTRKQVTASDVSGRLGDLVSEKNGRRGPLDNIMHILRLKLGNISYGLIVDNIVDTEEIVVKPLHEQMKSARVFSGTTVLGDGKIALILDIAALAELGSISAGRIEQPEIAKKIKTDDKQYVVLFNIGGTELFVIPLFIIAHIQLIKAEEIIVGGGKEFLQLKSEAAPLVRINNVVDAIEGEYSEDLYVIIIKGKNPIGIVASQIEDTAFIESSLDNTVSREGIIGGTILGGKLALILDVFKLIEMAEPEWFRRDTGHVKYAKRILLVEDTQFYSSMIKSFFHGTGAQIVSVQNGKEGIEAISREKFDFIISDLEMPVMDGFEFAKYVKSSEQHRSIPLYAISSLFNEKQGLRVAQEAGFDDYIPKLNRDAMLKALSAIAAGPGD